MKQAENKEMDLLLRNMAKQAKSVSDSGNGLLSAAHLDADELSAFAERALPPAAQARYTAHLVDCGQCRKLVAQLSAAAGFPVAEVPAEVQPKTSFWERLPAFLSPAVLRFAVPALAMLAVITVGVITFRQQPFGDFVARNQEPTQSKPTAVSSADSQPGEGTVQPQNQGSPATAANRANADSVKAGEKRGQVDKVTAETGASADIPSATVAAKEAPAPPPPSKAGVEEPKFAPEPSPAPASRVQVGATRQANKNEALAKDAKEKQDAAAGVAAQPAAAQQVRDGADQERDAYVSRSRKAAAAGRGGAAANSVETRRAETEQAKRSDQDDATREVSGHRFRKQGNAWVDLAYDGRSVTTVVRGSEQYRALIADEPGIHTIAQRLSGEVLILWNGRAYRIR